MSVHHTLYTKHRKCDILVPSHFRNFKWYYTTLLRCNNPTMAWQGRTLRLEGFHLWPIPNSVFSWNKKSKNKSVADGVVQKVNMCRMYAWSLVRFNIISLRIRFMLHSKWDRHSALCTHFVLAHPHIPWQRVYWSLKYATPRVEWRWRRF